MYPERTRKIATTCEHYSRTLFNPRYAVIGKSVTYRVHYGWSDTPAMQVSPCMFIVTDLDSPKKKKKKKSQLHNH